ncbi:hypothetical protein NX059_012405 [Plenodomus lindquistii]|nr:hypothetical protein NX059_012405 [Plenodomus lindquistii]
MKLAALEAAHAQTLAEERKKYGRKIKIPKETHEVELADKVPGYKSTLTSAEEAYKQGAADERKRCQLIYEEREREFASERAQMLKEHEDEKRSLRSHLKQLMDDQPKHTLEEAEGARRPLPTQAQLNLQVDRARRKVKKLRGDITVLQELRGQMQAYGDECRALMEEGKLKLDLDEHLNERVECSECQALLTASENCSALEKQLREQCNPENEQLGANECEHLERQVEEILSQHKNHQVKMLALAQHITLQTDFAREQRATTIRAFLDQRGRIQVTLRLRKGYHDDNRNSITVRDKSITVPTSSGPRDYKFDRIFTVGTTNDDLWKETGSLLMEMAFKGDPLLFLAHGETGSGKTYTTSFLAKTVLSQLFEKQKDVTAQGGRMTVKISVLEVHMRGVRDLCRVKHASDMQTSDRNLDWDSYFRDVPSLEAGSRMLSIAVSQRTTADMKKFSGKNSASSRSHLLMKFSFEIHDNNDTIVSTVAVFDLAGSESSKTLPPGDESNRSIWITTSLQTVTETLSAVRRKATRLATWKEPVAAVLRPVLSTGKPMITYITTAYDDEAIPLKRSCDKAMTVLRDPT